MFIYLLISFMIYSLEYSYLINIGIIKVVNALCGMHNMPGCTMQKLCEEKKYKDKDVCGIFSTYKELCIDMPKMANCTTYNSMCVSGITINH